MIQIFNPKNEAAWHRLRSKDITASVAGALIGEHDFWTVYKLWALKSGQLFEDFEETPAIKRGRLLEPVAVEMLREMQPTWKIQHNTGKAVQYYRDTESRIGATPDVIAICPIRGQGIVQIKSVEKSTFRRKWLADNEVPEPPLWIAVQAIIEAYMTGSAWAAVAPLVVGFGIDMPIIDIPLIPGVVDRIKRESRAFWEMVESGDEPTPDYLRDAETIDALFANADASGEVDLSQDKELRLRIKDRARLMATRKDCDASLSAIDAEIKAKMRGASLAHLAGGDKITWKAQRKIGTDGRATAFRVLRVPVIAE